MPIANFKKLQRMLSVEIHTDAEEAAYHANANTMRNRDKPAIAAAAALLQSQITAKSMLPTGSCQLEIKGTAPNQKYGSSNTCEPPLP